VEDARQFLLGLVGRPCAAAKDAMVPFMPPRQLRQVPSNAATSARWPSRLSSIAVFMVLISPRAVRW